jgi:hypothetical protein
MQWMCLAPVSVPAVDVLGTSVVHTILVLIPQLSGHACLRLATSCSRVLFAKWHSMPARWHSMPAKLRLVCLLAIVHVLDVGP